MTDRYVLALDIGGTQYRAAVIDLEGKIHSRKGEITDGVDRPTLLERLFASVREVLTTCPSSALLGLGVSVPGPVDPWSGIIFSPPNLAALRNVPIKALLEEQFQLPTFVGNDANLGALGECHYGAGVGCANMVYITVSTGVGGGIILNGKLLLGSAGLAGEIGHMTIDINGPPCKCGNIGCLETFASGPAIAAAARARSEGTEALLECAEGDPERITARTVQQAAERGDAVAIDIYYRAGTALGVGVLNLIHLLDPERVVIGGGVTKAGPLLFEPLAEVLRSRAMEGFRGRVKVVPATLGDDACLLGAVALVRSSTGVLTS